MSKLAERVRHPLFLGLHGLSALTFGVVALLHWVAVGHHWKAWRVDKDE